MITIRSMSVTTLVALVNLGVLWGTGVRADTLPGSRAIRRQTFLLS